jgi:hypothetical protein
MLAWELNADPFELGPCVIDEPPLLMMVIDQCVSREISSFFLESFTGVTCHRGGVIASEVDPVGVPLLVRRTDGHFSNDRTNDRATTTSSHRRCDKTTHTYTVSGRPLLSCTPGATLFLPGKCFMTPSQDGPPDRREMARNVPLTLRSPSIQVPSPRTHWKRRSMDSITITPSPPAIILYLNETTLSCRGDGDGNGSTPRNDGTRCYRFDICNEKPSDTFDATPTISVLCSYFSLEQHC